MCEVKRSWKNMSDADKALYQQLSESDKIRFAGENKVLKDQQVSGANELSGGEKRK
jgi:hypothetical protein